MGNTPSVNMSSENMNEVEDSLANNSQSQSDEIHNSESVITENNSEVQATADNSADSDHRSSLGRRQPPFLRFSLFSTRWAAARGDQNQQSQEQTEPHRNSEYPGVRTPRHPSQSPLRTLEMVSIHRRQVSHLFGSMARQRILSAARSSQRTQSDPSNRSAIPSELNSGAHLGNSDFENTTVTQNPGEVENAAFYLQDQGANFEAPQQLYSSNNSEPNITRDSLTGVSPLKDDSSQLTGVSPLKDYSSQSCLATSSSQTSTVVNSTTGNPNWNILNLTNLAPQISTADYPIYGQGSQIDSQPPNGTNMPASDASRRESSNDQNPDPNNNAQNDSSENCNSAPNGNNSQHNNTREEMNVMHQIPLFLPLLIRTVLLSQNQNDNSGDNSSHSESSNTNSQSALGCPQGVPGDIPNIPAGIPNIPGGIPNIPGGIPNIPGGIQNSPGRYSIISITSRNPSTAPNRTGAAPAENETPGPNRTNTSDEIPSDTNPPLNELVIINLGHANSSDPGPPPVPDPAQNSHNQDLNHMRNHAQQSRQTPLSETQPAIPLMPLAGLRSRQRYPEVLTTDTNSAPQPDAAEEPSNQRDDAQSVGYFDIRRNFRYLFRFIRGIETLITARGGMQNSGSQTQPEEGGPQINTGAQNQRLGDTETPLSNLISEMGRLDNHRAAESFQRRYSSLSSSIASRDGTVDDHQRPLNPQDVMSSSSQNIGSNSNETGSSPRIPGAPGNGVLTRLIVSINPSGPRGGQGGGISGVNPVAESIRARRTWGTEDTATDTSSRQSEPQPCSRSQPSSQGPDISTPHQEPTSEDSELPHDFTGRASPNDIITINVVLSILTQIIRDDVLSRNRNDYPSSEYSEPIASDVPPQPTTDNTNSGEREYGPTSSSLGTDAGRPRPLNALFFGSGTDRLELIILNYSTGEVVILDSDAISSGREGTNLQDIHLEGLEGIQDLLFSGDNTGSQYENFLRIAEILGPARPRSVPAGDIDEELPVIIWRREDLNKDVIEDDFISPNDTIPPKVPQKDEHGDVNTGADDSNVDTESLIDKATTDHHQAPEPVEVSSNTGNSGSTSDLRSPVCRMRLKDILGSNEKCSICLTNYEEGDQLRIIKCQHGFHKDCIDKWLVSYVNSCPVCRNKAVKPRNRPGTASRGRTVTDSDTDRNDDGSGNTGNNERTGPGTFMWRIL